MFGNLENVTREELKRLARKLSDMPMFRDRVELYDPELVGLLDDEELRALVQNTVDEYKAALRE